MFYPTPFNLPSGPEPIKTWDYHPVKVRGKKEEKSISVQEIKKSIFENKQEKTKKAKTRRKSNNKRKSNKNK